MEKMSLDDEVRLLQEKEEEKFKEAIKPSLATFDEALQEVSELPVEEQIAALWGTVRALLERSMRLEYELQRGKGGFFGLGPWF
jgi:hypothetical protein